MKFEIETEDRYTAIRLLEEKLDTRVAPQLKSEFVLLSANGSRNLLLDMGTIAYADSSGLGAILMANRICNDAGGIMVMCRVSENVMRVIKMSMLDSVLTIVPTVEEAREAIYMNDLESEIEDELSDEGNEPEIQ